MTVYVTHRAILEQWQALPERLNRKKDSWIAILVEDLCRYLGQEKATYFMVRRWWERDNIPIEYHQALIKAAKLRSFTGITYRCLSEIKASRCQSECANGIAVA